ncbi:MAG: glucosamine-6-phosphate deaminase [Bacteroidetes bacterium]|jgi:glucosamine-6-phosphate deaminase|nr:glucosamine-6-phosphate deaminase [Bacteroidota bacterium]MBT3748696.1 glucosamine-6-phosphate deaminase [Bacteroidota bacterium]MBT4398921.1 glucosamine-6-phosphate deaminase [Bacteroidota bacterium]MBT4411070.1 glucosamine-6-phosphate deaminase [Bacteroidota bacterium]MBT5428186.1 glucosamine-6-phosphate deaminase [Bacteroidota bacterium]
MDIVIANSKSELGEKAAQTGAGLIREAILTNGSANIILATGASQFEMLSELVKQDIEWEKVTAFHLDEYIGLSENHPASFRKYLKERFVEKISLNKFHYIRGETDPFAECSRLGEIIRKYPIDVAFVGIGENGHLAFNDPPADFDTDDPYLIVKLDDKCRRQQLGEGWFPIFDDVPEEAISMSVKQIMKSRSIICSVPDVRKADAVKESLKGEITPLVPASVLQQHKAVWMYLDKNSAKYMG